MAMFRDVARRIGHIRQRFHVNTYGAIVGIPASYTATPFPKRQRRRIFMVVPSGEDYIVDMDFDILLAFSGLPCSVQVFTSFRIVCLYYRNSVY